MDNPTHMVVIENEQGEVLRYLGPMNLGRANLVKQRFENTPEWLVEPTNKVRIIDSPTWDFKTNKEVNNVDPDEARQRKIDDWRRDTSGGSGS